MFEGVEVEQKKYVCGTCDLCVKDDGEPYCVVKDLYTTVRLKDECDEIDFYGNYCWVKEKNLGG